MPRLRQLWPWGRAATALWIWRNRRQVRSWASFAGSAPKRLLDGRSRDLAVEGRLRLALSRDLRTRSLNLDVRVEDGEAVLKGRAPREARRAAVRIAEGTRGVQRVWDLVEEEKPRKGWLGRSAS